MLTQYIQAAMRKATYEVLGNNEGYYGKIPGLRGVYSNAKTLAKCRDQLQEVLEGWILLNLVEKAPMPKISGIGLTFSKPRKRTVS